MRKRICIVISIICIAAIIAVALYDHLHPRYATIMGTVYKTDYEIPAVLSMKDGRDEIHWWFDNGNYPILLDDYYNVSIINITGDTCEIVYKCDDHHRAFARNVPLTYLTYDNDAVEQARNAGNHFRIEIHYNNTITVRENDGSFEKYTIDPQLHGADYPEGCLAVPKKAGNIWVLIMYAFVIINVPFCCVMIYRHKKNKTVHYLPLTIVNTLLLILPLMYLMQITGLTKLFRRLL